MQRPEPPDWCHPRHRDLDDETAKTMGNAPSNGHCTDIMNGAAPLQNMGTVYNQLHEQEIQHWQNRNMLTEVLEPQHAAHALLRGVVRPGLASPTLQTGQGPEEIWSRAAYLYQTGDPTARAFVDDNKLHPLVGAYNAGRDFVPRPWPNRFRSQHYNPQHPLAAPSAQRQVNAAPTSQHRNRAF